MIVYEGKRSWATWCIDVRAGGPGRVAGAWDTTLCPGTHTVGVGESPYDLMTPSLADRTLTAPRLYRFYDNCWCPGCSHSGGLRWHTFCRDPRVAASWFPRSTRPAPAQLAPSAPLCKPPRRHSCATPPGLPS
uniref:SFRICE_020409 n=1 Tax=Spodoptera frugiperda TaxID=7108 RepID=A0A2H1X1D6_SPOFR